MPLTLFLGPQRFRPTVFDALRSIGVEGRVALVTAGWQEREDEDSELRDHLRLDAVNLQIYQRYDDVLRNDAELQGALRERQDRLQRVQELYRLQLDHTLAAAREMMQRDGDDEPLEAQRRSTIRAAKALDQQHLRRIRQVHKEFDNRWQPTRRPAVAAQRQELAAILEGSSALAIAGGHVAVLLSRLRLFDLLPVIGDRPVVAWSAGAMVLTERVVLFHDSPPQGPGNAEVFESGLARCPGLVSLPHAQRRLRLDDPFRVSLFARRFSPAVCLLLDEGARIDWDGESWTAGPGTRRMNRNGNIRTMAPA